MIIARLFNLPSSLAVLGFPDFPVSTYRMWKETRRAWLRDLQDRKCKVFNSAYIVSTNGKAMNKIDYLFDHVIDPIWRNLRQPFEGETLQSYHTELMRFDGMGSFIAGQVIADLKYVSNSPLFRASDWNSWAPIGPGSRRGLNRYFGRKVEAPITPARVQEELAMLQCNVQLLCGLELPIHDVQNCCCEYDKYVRVFNGEGRPKSLYNGR